VTAVPEPGFVLLVNAKAEKGFDLLVQVAASLPHIPFLAIASQSDAEEAHELIRKFAAGNVRIIEKTTDMASLYRGARVVAVPSYRFVETFSRVCIEAQRYGKPVIGSDVGNVPYLLSVSGIVLPESVARWSQEIARLYGDPDYYAERCRLAVENSARYSQAAQRKDILKIVQAQTDAVLVCIGSGIGNMLHTGPMIRNLARQIGRRVDLLVAEDHSTSLFLLQNDEVVNTVYSLRNFALRRRYDTIFVTHSFGTASLPFHARRVVFSRDWDSFHPGHALHEAVFNLEAAKVLLGVDYDPADVARDYYLGNCTYKRPNTRLVGFHGGSKDGFWVSKRWTHFTALADRLREAGYSVASFGTPAEFVEGTLDRTGGTIEEMVHAMMQCDLFISNDSGVMNIANALGIPVLGIFGPTNWKTRGPLSTLGRSVSLTSDCSPCESQNPKHFLSGGCSCIAHLDVERVWAAVLALIADADGISKPLKLVASR
jgi:ADP-heptose:LPS heptosyltransferase